MLLDLSARPLAIPGDAPPAEAYDWEALAALWDTNELQSAHDWLNARWSRRVELRLAGQSDPDARFLQGLAFAALALHFTQNCNQSGALLMLDDAVITLMCFRPSHLGVQVDPILDTLHEMRPLIASLAPDAENPSFPFVYRRFMYRH